MRLFFNYLMKEKLKLNNFKEKIDSNTFVHANNYVFIQ